MGLAHLHGKHHSLAILLLSIGLSFLTPIYNAVADPLCSWLESGYSELNESHPVHEVSRTQLVLHQLSREFDIFSYDWKAVDTNVGYSGPKGYPNLNVVFVRDYWPLQTKVMENGNLEPVVR